MNRLLDLLVPQGWLGFLGRMAMLEIIVNITMIAISVVIYAPGTFVLSSAMQVATLVSVPILGAFMLVLRHSQQLKTDLAYLAATDMLTGLPNRRAFMARIGDPRDGEQAGQAGTLLILDVDHFKRVNDTHGHAVGDLCLQAIGRRLLTLVRDNDPVGRIGGEEFAIFLTHAPRHLAEGIGRRLTDALEVEATGKGVHISITASVGAADGSPGMPLGQLFHHADAALYRAKQAGRARLVFHAADQDSNSAP